MLAYSPGWYVRSVANVAGASAPCFNHTAFPEYMRVGMRVHPDARAEVGVLPLENEPVPVPLLARPRVIYRRAR